MTQSRLKQFFYKIKRPPGPSFSQLQKQPLYKDDFCNLEYPIQLTKKYGDLIYIQSARQYIVTGPDGFEYILKTNTKNYQKYNFFYNRIKPLFGNGSLLVIDGEYWKKHRKIINPAFHTLAIHGSAPIITKHAEQLANRWRFEPPEKPVNLFSLMNQVTLGATFQIMTGNICPEKRVKELEKIFHFANWYISRAIFIKPWKPTINNLKFYCYKQKMHRYLLSVIEDRRKQMHAKKNENLKKSDSAAQAIYEQTSQKETNEHTHTTCPYQSFQQKENGQHNIHRFSRKLHLLDLLLFTKDENDETLTDFEILDELKTFLTAGYETTACTLAWMWELLADNPFWRQQLEEELDRVLNGQPPTFEDLPQLPILKSIVQETLRLYPAVPGIARSNIENDTLFNYHIPKGSLIALNIYALHRHPKYWEYPEEFNPERFLNPKTAERHPFAYLPFSTGPRMCIGSQLATLEVMLIAGTLAQYFRFEKVKKIKTRMEPCISLRPRNGLWMKIVQREK